MCYAIPAKIIKINEDSAEVDYGGVIKKVNVSLIEDAKAGDFVLIHAGFAIEKLDRKSAEESLQIIRNQIAEMERNG
ncbi:HypC/HybG/HupF family hydrogenase formation chaperone [Candidatus Woesearchaeota archaeon]|nr:HypC/HybG/HupF family hydrogenase formation chaperone [Candidatus Woesearchaeota archaeon]